MFRSLGQVFKLAERIGANTVYIKANCVASPSRLCKQKVSVFKICRHITMSTSNFCGKPDKGDLKQCLSPLQYHVTQEKGTERPYTGEYTDFFEPGTYVCVVCKSKIFSSESKFESGCGWPAFYDVVDPKCVKLTEDLSHGMVRTEVTCSNCGAHLGHVFNDGPKPTGLRYCINSVSLDFIAENA